MLNMAWNPFGGGSNCIIGSSSLVPVEARWMSSSRPIDVYVLARLRETAAEMISSMQERDMFPLEVRFRSAPSVHSHLTTAPNSSAGLDEDDWLMASVVVAFAFAFAFA